MIKSFSIKPYTKDSPLPAYVKLKKFYEILATAPGGYRITLAKIYIGESCSAGTPLSHAKFESYTKYGEKARVTRTRASGYNREIVALQNAIIQAGAEIENVTINNSNEIITYIAQWYSDTCPELTNINIVSQMCH